MWKLQGLGIVSSTKFDISSFKECMWSLPLLLKDFMLNENNICETSIFVYKYNKINEEINVTLIVTVSKASSTVLPWLSAQLTRCSNQTLQGPPASIYASYTRAHIHDVAITLFCLFVCFQ